MQARPNFSAGIPVSMSLQPYIVCGDLVVARARTRAIRSRGSAAGVRVRTARADVRSFRFFTRCDVCTYGGASRRLYDGLHLERFYNGQSGREQCEQGPREEHAPRT